ncbi:hypothetical protein BC941DRAFT_475524 [Chlamydoabsidia padenii]|nr:hypothetical protein BC941DRAFT_475524 [Chlamydoabsidia padenii]
MDTEADPSNTSHPTPPPVDGRDHYSKELYYEQCQRFVEMTFKSRLEEALWNEYNGKLNEEDVPTFTTENSIKTICQEKYYPLENKCREYVAENSAARLWKHKKRIRKWEQRTPQADHANKILYETTKMENLETELNDLKKIEDKEMNHEAVHFEAMDTTIPTPTSDVQYRPSAAMINRICGLLMRHLRQKPNDDPLTQNEIMNTFLTINEQSTALIIKIFTFFQRFMIQEVKEADIDGRVLVNLHVIDMCNAVLQSTGYDRYSRKMTPEPSMGTLHALHINLHGLYSFTHLSLATSNKAAVFETCIDMEKVEMLCRKRKVELDNKITITSSGIIHLQVTYYKKESSHPTASSTFDHKAHQHKGGTEDNWNTMADLKEQTTKLHAALKGINAPISGLRKSIACNHKIFNIVKAFKKLPTRQLMEEKLVCIENRNTDKASLDNGIGFKIKIDRHKRILVNNAMLLL